MLQVGETLFDGRTVVGHGYRLVECRNCRGKYKTWVAIDKNNSVIDRRAWLCPSCTRYEEELKEFRTIYYPHVYRDIKPRRLPG